MEMETRMTTKEEAMTGAIAVIPADQVEMMRTTMAAVLAVMTAEVTKEAETTGEMIATPIVIRATQTASRVTGATETTMTMTMTIVIAAGQAAADLKSDLVTAARVDLQADQPLEIRST